MISLDFAYTDQIDWKSLLPEAKNQHKTLLGRSGAGREFLGWLDLPEQITPTQLDHISQTAHKIRECDLLVTIGIGGSYLGAKAVISALENPFAPDFKVLFAGHQMDAVYHQQLLDYLQTKSFSINAISKSGTTTEPGLAFRLLWNLIPQDQRKNRVFLTTDAKKGSLRSLANKFGLESFVIPDDVGGRFSVFTPVGLLPIAAAGIDIHQLIEGAQLMSKQLKATDNLEANPALQYACYRNACYRSGKKIEILAAYQQSLSQIGEWWKQLFGESEGKDKKGIFPASVNLSTDLHSMGQWIQDAERTVFETVIDIENQSGPQIPSQTDDTDQLNYLAGRELHAINRTALKATIDAHQSGQVPCLRLTMPTIDARHIGALLYLMEFACGISAYMSGVNPFDQPGVEAYKTKMFAMLGKPGFS